MKFNRIISNLIICFLLVLYNFDNIYLTKELTKNKKTTISKNLSENKREKSERKTEYKSKSLSFSSSKFKTNTKIKTSSRSNTQFHSRLLKDDNLIKAFNLNTSAHLIARCPTNSIIIKLIFEKRNDRIIDVGFNCRKERNFRHEQMKFERRTDSNSFDEITPPDIECPRDHALSGFEFERINKINNFIFYCNKIENMHSEKIIKDKFYPENFIDPLERVAFSKFLPHTDISLSKVMMLNGAIKSIHFSRGQGMTNQNNNNLGGLSYSFTTSIVGNNDKSPSTKIEFRPNIEHHEGNNSLGKENTVCFQPIPDFQRIQCENGLVCRTNKEQCLPGFTGCTSFCLKPIALPENNILGKINTLCYKPTTNFQTIQCETGLLCRTRTEECLPGMTGCSSYCLKPIDLSENNSLGNENTLCYKPTPNFQTILCENGLVCRTKTEECRPGFTGCSSYCLKPIALSENNSHGQFILINPINPTVMDRWKNFSLTCEEIKFNKETYQISAICKKINNNKKKETTIDLNKCYSVNNNSVIHSKMISENENLKELCKNISIDSHLYISCKNGNLKININQNIRNNNGILTCQH
jgi:hypothetical protein